MSMPSNPVRNALLISALLLVGTAGAQVGDIHVTARKADGQVLVKCMPTNAATWYYMMQGGATVELDGRAAITLRHGAPEDFLATGADEQWRNALAELAREIPTPAVDERNVDAVIKAGKDFDRQYLAWILLTAYTPELSRLSGFQFALPDDGRAISGSVQVPSMEAAPFRFASDQLRGDLDGIPFEAQGGDKSAVLRWSHAPLRGHVVAYLIERSRDGKDFSPIGPPVVYDKRGKGVAGDPLGMEWTDPLPANGETWHYRLVALDAFGMRSANNTVREVTPQVSTALPPFGSARIEARPDGSSTIQWNYPDNPYVKSFHVVHSTKGALGPYELSHEGELPPDTRTFTHTLPPDEDVHYRIIAAGKDGNAVASDLIYRALADEVPPDAPEGVRVSVDSTGLATIQWQPVQDKDLKGYRVFKSFQAGGGFVQLTHAPIADTIFSDTLDLQRLDKLVYYQVTAVDGSYNQSDPSETAVGRMPDVVPPSAPLLTRVEVDRDNRVQLAWQPSSSPDVAYYEPQYRDGDDTLFHSLGSVTPAQHVFQDAAFKEVPQWREYRILAVDSAGNQAGSNLRRAVRRDRATRPPAPSDLRATVEEGSVRLSWALDPGVRVSHLLIYLQRESEGKPVLVDRVEAAVGATSPMPAMEGDQYRVRAVNEQGVKSLFSEAAQVRLP